MPLFGGKNKFNTKPPTIRIEKVAIDKPKPRSFATTSAKSSPRASPKPRLPQRQSASPYPSSDEKRLERKRKTASAGPARVTFDKDSDAEDGDDWMQRLEPAKRQRLDDGRFVDENRVLAHAPAFTGEEKDLKFVHAAEIANLGLKCAPLEGVAEDDVLVKLQYPSIHRLERYELVRGHDKIDTVTSIIQVIQHVAEVYLTTKNAEAFTEPQQGLIRRLKRTSVTREWSAFKAALSETNKKILSLAKDGTILKNLNDRRELPRDLVEFILTQVYDRTVALKVEALSKYKNGSDNVYGELKHRFISEVLVERTKMTSDQVFIDLGSGVGNVVFQAALEIGCESWGCEMMPNAYTLAEAQKKEFAARCQLWGIAPGKVRLVSDDFTKNAKIINALKRADVVLVNNKAFTPELNAKLVDMFLDLKKGCKIVSLKSFAHDQKSQHNINDVASNILDVERLSYGEDCVSWTKSGGEYYISTKK